MLTWRTHKRNLNRYLSVVQSLISLLNNIALGANSQVFGAREDMVSVPKYAERLYLLFKVELFLRL